MDSSIISTNDSLSDSNILEKEIQMYNNGEMVTNTLRFQFFVMCASKVITFKHFYELSLQQINEYFRTVQIFSDEELKNVLEMLVSQSKTPKEADLAITKLLPSIRCPFKKGKYYISPCCCEELFKDIVKSKYRLKDGNLYTVGNLFNFQSDRMLQMRLGQEKYRDPPQFSHSEDAYTVIFSNIYSNYNDKSKNSSNIFDKMIENDEKCPKFEKEIKKPDPWCSNIIQAVRTNENKSIQYDVYLLPLLRNLQDKDGNTPAHHASIVGQHEVIKTLKKLNADFSIFNNEGNLPIHVIKNEYSLKALIECGCNPRDLNKKGMGIIEIMSNPFKEDVIKKIIYMDYNILEPNSKGIFWAQFVVSHNYFIDNKSKDSEFVKFWNFIYPILSNCDYSYYKNDSILQNLIKTVKNKINELNLIKDLRNAVLDIDIKKINTLVGIGVPPDTFVENVNLTNLMIVSEKGQIDLVKLFASNFCDPNKVNDNGENSFWLSAWNNHFDVSTLLQTKFNANPNILSKSGKTIMHIAYAKKLTELFYYLLDLGASPNIENQEHETVQFKAFIKRDDEIAEIIQDEYNGDINVVNKDGNTLGHIAIIEKDKERLEYIINRRINLESKNSVGQSLFISAMLTQNDESIHQILIDHGSDINARDNEGNTTFYTICSDETFNRKKFDFLLRNNCDINIQNNKHDFPVSQLIEKNRKEEALLILDDYKANIVDPKSKTEPILLAISKHDKFWFEKLVDCGANAMNKTFPLIEKYLDESFFSFETLKKMKNYNSTIGCPIQIALSKKLNDEARFLWENASNDDRVLISKSVDKDNRIPLTISIINDDKYFIEQLVNKDYEMSTQDKVGRTPFIYACSKQMNDLMKKMVKLLSTEQLSVIDKGFDSALSIVAKNNQVKFAELLYKKNVEVRGINIDKHGIIQHYLNLENMYDEFLRIAQQNYDLNLNKWRELDYRINEIENEIKIKNNRITYIEGLVNSSFMKELSDETRIEKINLQNEINNLRKEQATKVVERDNANGYYQIANNNLTKLKQKTRADKLKNIEDLRRYTTLIFQQ